MSVPAQAESFVSLEQISTSTIIRAPQERVGFIMQVENRGIIYPYSLGLCESSGV